MATFTLGPWRTHLSTDGGSTVSIVSDQGRFVCGVLIGERDDEGRANERLIKASPELYRAYVDLWVSVENDELSEKFFELRERFRDLTAAIRDPEPKH